MPSALASATSQGEAGSSSGDSRAMRVTEAAPCRRATRATSMATLPPPMTATRLPWVGDSPVEFTSLRYSTPHKTPAASAPGTGRRMESWVPTPRKTAANPSRVSRSSMVAPSPMGEL